MSGFLTLRKKPLMNNALYTYLSALTRARVWLVLFALAGAFLAYAITLTFSTTYESHFSYVVSLSQREESEEFQFDGFYALQATDLFAATLTSWIQTPEVIVAAHERVGLELPSNNPRALTRIVRAEKTAPQLVQVTVRGDNPTEGLVLVQGLQAVMDERVDEYHDQGIPALAFRIVAGDAWQGHTDIARGIIVIATFIAILFIGVNVVLLAETFRQETK